jgi:hypothetical protein
MLTVILAWGWGVVAARTRRRNPRCGNPWRFLIQDLAHEKFRVREDASRQIWQIGEGALPALEKAATEMTRSKLTAPRELIRKIEMHITPEPTLR